MNYGHLFPELATFDILTPLLVFSKNVIKYSIGSHQLQENLHTSRLNEISAFSAYMVDGDGTEPAGAHIRYAKVTVADGPPGASVEDLEDAGLGIRTCPWTGLCQTECTLGSCIQR